MLPSSLCCDLLTGYWFPWELTPQSLPDSTTEIPFSSAIRIFQDPDCSDPRFRSHSTDLLKASEILPTNPQPISSMPPKFLSLSDILHPDPSRDFRSPHLAHASHRLSARPPHYLIPPEMLQLQISSAPLLPSPSCISAPPNRSRARPSPTSPATPIQSPNPAIQSWSPATHHRPCSQTLVPSPYLTARGSDASPPLPAHPPAALCACASAHFPRRPPIRRTTCPSPCPAFPRHAGVCRPVGPALAAQLKRWGGSGNLGHRSVVSQFSALCRSLNPASQC